MLLGSIQKIQVASLKDFLCCADFKSLTRRNARATAYFHADANAPAGSQRQHMPFTVTTFPVKMRLERPCGCAAMKAPVGLSSRRAVCVSRWKGFALTNVRAATNAKNKNQIPLNMPRVQRRRPLPAAEAGRSCWGRGQQDTNAAQGMKWMLGAATLGGHSKSFNQR